MVKLQPIVLVHFVCTEQDKWGIDPKLIVKGTMYNLTLLFGVLSTPNPGIVDEKCTSSLRYFDLLGQTSNDGPHTLFLGSDTGCMT